MSHKPHKSFCFSVIFFESPIIRIRVSIRIDSKYPNGRNVQRPAVGVSGIGEETGIGVELAISKKNITTFL